MPSFPDLWNLRTNPFYPEVDSAGKAIPKRALERSLKPTVDKRVLPLYFEIYDWSSSDLVGPLSREKGLEKFPDVQTLPSDAPLLILVSGSGQSGLDSMGYLILHKIGLMSGNQ